MGNLLSLINYVFKITIQTPKKVGTTDKIEPDGELMQNKIGENLKLAQEKGHYKMEDIICNMDSRSQ